MSIENNSSKRFCATVLYPNEDGADFDFEHYVKVLIPKYVEILGDNCVKYEIRKGLKAPGSPKLHFLCIANFWIKSGEQFVRSMGDPRMKEIMMQIGSFTEIQPIRQFDEVLSS